MIIPSSLLAKCRDRIRLIAIEIWRALSKTKAPFYFSFPEYPGKSTFLLA
jgi:hypothetical protein